MKKALVFLSVIALLVMITSCSAPAKQKTYFELQQELYKQNRTSDVAIAPSVETVVVEGIGIDKDDALLDARLKALQQVVGLKLYSQSQVSNFTLVDKQTYTKTQGYIKSEKILSESAFQISYYKVKCSFEVSKDIPDDDFFFVIKKMRKPKVGVWIPANLYKGLLSFEDRSAEVNLLNRLKEYGFDVYDTERLQELMQIKADFTPDVKSFRKYGVDVLITGELFGESTGSISGLMGARATVNLKVFWTQTGQIIASDSVTEGKADVSAAIAVKNAVGKAAYTIGESLSRLIVKDWMSQVANGLPLEMNIMNIDYDSYVDFVSMLRKTSGVIDLGSTVFEQNTADIVVYTFLLPEEFYAKIIRTSFKNSPTMINQSLTQITFKLN